MLSLGRLSDLLPLLLMQLRVTTLSCRKRLFTALVKVKVFDFDGLAGAMLIVLPGIILFLTFPP